MAILCLMSIVDYDQQQPTTTIPAAHHGRRYDPSRSAVPRRRCRCGHCVRRVPAHFACARLVDRSCVGASWSSVRYRSSEADVPECDTHRADLSSLLRPAHAPSSSQLALSSSPLCPSSRLSSLLLISAPSLSFSSLPSDVKTAYSIAPRQSRIKLVYAGEHEREKVWERAAAGWREGECTGEVTVEEAVDHDDIGLRYFSFPLARRD